MKQNIAILTDTASDLTLEFTREQQITVIPFTIYLEKDGEQREYRDKFEVSADDIYQAMKAGTTPGTATAQMGDIIAAYDNLAAEGFTDCICIIASSGLSSMFQNFTIAKEMYEGPLHIHLIDSKTLSFAEGAYVSKAAELVRQGADIATIITTIEQMKRESKLFFVPETLEYLIRGGRIGTINAMLGNLLNIIPIAHVDPEGKFAGYEKKRGIKKAVKRLAELICADADPKRDIIYVGSGGPSEHLPQLEQYIAELAPGVAVQIAEVGASIAVHAGPGIVGIARVPYYLDK